MSIFTYRIQGTLRPTKYAGRYTVTLIPGDGIGAEMTDSVKTIFKAANVPVDWEEYSVSGYKQDKQNEGSMKAAVDSLRRNKIGLKGVLACIDDTE